MRKFEHMGGNIVQRKIDAFSELDGKYDVVVNCTGLGAKYLCGDHKLVPLRGQTIKVVINLCIGLYNSYYFLLFCCEILRRF